MVSFLPAFPLISYMLYVQLQVTIFCQRWSNKSRVCSCCSFFVVLVHKACFISKIPVTYLHICTCIHVCTWFGRLYGFFLFRNNSESNRQLVGLLGRGISPSQGRCIHRTQAYKKADIYPCLERDSNSRFQRHCVGEDISCLTSAIKSFNLWNF
jgi:hypothetical protein